MGYRYIHNSKLVSCEKIQCYGTEEKSGRVAGGDDLGKLCGLVYFRNHITTTQDSNLRAWGRNV